MRHPFDSICLPSCIRSLGWGNGCMEIRSTIDLCQEDPRSQKRHLGHPSHGQLEVVPHESSAFVGGGTVHAWDRSAEHPKVTAQLRAVMDEVIQHPGAKD